MARSGQMASQLRHFTQSLGRCSTPKVPSASVNFARAPVGQNTAHIWQEAHASVSMTTWPHRRVSTMTSSGSPKAARLSSRRSRRSGMKCGRVPSSITLR